MDFDTAKQAMAGLHSGSYVGLDILTPVTLKGRNNPLKGRVKKRVMGALVKCFTHSESYTNSINNQKEREGGEADFVPGPRAWGTRIQGTPFVYHVKDEQGKFYLEVFFQRSGTVTYEVDGVAVPMDQIPGLPTPSPVREDSQGGIEKKIILRDVTVENILAIRMNEQEYQ